jgi:hypothetical protein
MLSPIDRAASQGRGFVSAELQQYCKSWAGRAYWIDFAVPWDRLKTAADIARG